MVKNIKSLLGYLPYLIGGLGIGFLYNNPPDWVSSKNSQIVRSEYFKNEHEKVRVYTTAWCKYCEQTRKYFIDHKIEFTDLDIEKNPQGAEEYKNLGGGGVPIVLIGTRKIPGYSPEIFDQELRKIIAK